MKSHLVGGSLALLLVATSMASAADNMTQESPDQWRTSKLVGVPVYGPDDKLVGKVSDVLMGKDGKATDVIVGLGGFLGLGEKEVSVAFDHVAFTDKPIAPPDNPAGFNNTLGGTSATGGVTPATTSSTGGVPTAVALGASPAADTPTGSGQALAAPAPMGMVQAMPPASTAYPDHGTIALTFDQLKSAPSFQFAK